MRKFNYQERFKRFLPAFLFPLLLHSQLWAAPPSMKTGKSNSVVLPTALVAKKHAAYHAKKIEALLNFLQSPFLVRQILLFNPDLLQRWHPSQVDSALTRSLSLVQLGVSIHPGDYTQGYDRHLAQFLRARIFEYAVMYGVQYESSNILALDHLLSVAQVSYWAGLAREEIGSLDWAMANYDLARRLCQESGAKAALAMKQVLPTLTAEQQAMIVELAEEEKRWLKLDRELEALQLQPERTQIKAYKDTFVRMVKIMQEAKKALEAAQEAGQHARFAALYAGSKKIAQQLAFERESHGGPAFQDALRSFVINKIQKSTKKIDELKERIFELASEEYLLYYGAFGEISLDPLNAHAALVKKLIDLEGKVSKRLADLSENEPRENDEREGTKWTRQRTSRQLVDPTSAVGR